MSKSDSTNVCVMGDFEVSEDTELYIKETSKFSLGDDDIYFATYWKPKKVENPKGLVFICHGFAEYFCPSYNEVSEALVQNGYLVFGHDHIGHGRSTGEQAIVKNLDEYVTPILTHVKKCKMITTENYHCLLLDIQWEV